MKRVMTHVLTTVALIMTFGLAVHASDGHDSVQQNGSTAKTAATQPEGGHPDRSADGHVD
jgi:hypothetical protein